MTVIYSTVSRARPGRRRDAVAAAAVGKKLVEREGAKDCRLSAAATAGENSGTFVFTMIDRLRRDAARPSRHIYRGHSRDASKVPSTSPARPSISSRLTVRSTLACSR
jgi:hypothetical protein